MTTPLGPRGVGITSDEVRRHNLALVLSRLHRGGAASRSVLTASTGLNRSTVRDLVGALEALGLVVERDPEIEGPGRPSPVVDLVAESAVALACAINVYSLEVASIGLGGHVFHRVVEPAPAVRRSPGEVADRIAGMARSVLEPLSPSARVIGAGVSVTAVVRRDDGVVRLAPNLGWEDVPLGAELERRLALPVLLANDADAGVLAEHVRGVAASASDVVYVSGEVGIGTGVISGGIPFGGSSGYAGEAGHMVVNPTGRTCGCGARGCWETEAGEEALLRATGTVVGTDGVAALADLRRRAEAGEERAIAGIAEVGQWLGVGLGDLVNLFNPELIVLGGFLNTFYPWLEDSARAGVASRALGAPLAAARILPGDLGADAPLLGAAEIALRQVLEDPATVEA